MTQQSEGLVLPIALAEVVEVGFTWEWDEEADDPLGCDFEPYSQFEAPDTTAWWFRLWTGNEDADSSKFRFFGATGAGDYVGFWLARPGMPIAEQPVIYIGSEGQCAVITRDLADLLWVFANGFGPGEAFSDPSRETQPDEEFHAIAERHAPGRRRSTAEIVAAARAEFPHFPEIIDAMCR
jgi:hypothetical protein